MLKELESTFGEILEDNRKRIYRICKVYALSPEDTNDLFQEVLLNIWRSLPGFKKQSELSTWVYRITLNVCLRWKLKNTPKIHVIPIEQVKPGQVVDHAGPGLEEKEKYRMLYACIDKLDDTDKSLVLLYLEDLPYKSIAEITGLTENHIAVKLSRIKRQLFNCLTIK